MPKPLALLLLALLSPCAQAEPITDKQAVEYLLIRSAALESEAAQAQRGEQHALAERGFWLIRYQALSDCLRDASSLAESKQCLGDDPT